jgi:hypothetical protein
MDIENPYEIDKSVNATKPHAAMITYARREEMRYALVGGTAANADEVRGRYWRELVSPLTVEQAPPSENEVNHSTR